IWAQTT
ncbi:hypothetical protein E2320_012277, partial [Naja naja]